MNSYLILFRGINVGGKNIVPMAGLKDCLEKLGFSNVSTYIASGNALLKSDLPPDKVQALIEDALPKTLKLDSKLVKVLILTRGQLQAVVDSKPKGFGDEPDTYHTDAIFLMNIDTSEGMKVFDPREGVDKIWPGAGVIYSQRLSAQRTKSRLSKVMGTPAYKSMTIRTWNTTIKLLELLKALEKST
jgi:uncharacterized protein (DUF1697 family)